MPVRCHRAMQPAVPPALTNCSAVKEASTRKHLAGVSLWFFLDSASPTHFDDAACLLLRIQSLAPTTLHVRRPKSSPRTSPSTAVTSTDSVVPFWLDTEMPCSNIVEDFFLSQMLSPDPQIRAESHDRFALLWHLLRAQSMNNTRLGINGGSQSPSGTPSWRRSAMGLPSLDDTPIGCRGPISANRLHRAAFDKCILVLLDNLDENTQCAISRESLFDRRSETTAKPVDSTTKSPRCCSPLTATPVDNLASVLRQKTHEWLSRALLTGQIGCVLAPLLAALLHPATAKVSLVALHNHKRALLKTKAREERRLARRRQRALGARPAAKPQQQRRKEKPKAPSPDSTTAPEAGEQKEQETGLTAEWQIVTVTESGTAVADFNNDLVDADTDTESDTDREIAEEERRIYAVSGGPGGEVVYHRRRSVDTEAAAAASNGYAKGSKGHKKHDVFAEEYKPIDVMTSLQTGDNDHDGRDRNNSTPDELRRSFIRDKLRCQALLGELLSRDTKASGNSLEMPVVSSSSSPEQRYMMTADFLSQFPFLVLPLHQHLLVYLHKFDCNQVLYALSRIRAILKTDLADQFLLVLAATPTAHQRESSTTSPKPSQCLSKFVFCNFPPICGTSLPDLLARHRRSLLGGDFSAQSTLEETTYIQQQAFPSLLDVLIYACVQCMSAVLPRTMKINGVECKSDTSGDQSGSSDSASSSAKTVSDSEVHAVLHIRLLAAEVLNHITKALSSLDTHSTEATKNASRPGQSEKKPKLEKLFASANDSHWWINTVLQRTSLPQATLHSLGVCIEFAHIRQSRFRALPPTALSRLPVCLHLLAANDYACTCSDSVFKTHMETLLDLTRNLLQLTDETPVWTTHRHGGSKSLNSRRSSVSSPIKRVGALATGHVWPWDKFAMPEGTFQLKHITRLLNALPPFFRQEPLLLSLCMSRFQQVPACLAAQGILFSALRLGLSSAAPSSARTPNQPGALLLPLNAFDLSAAPLYEIPSHPELHPIWFRFILNSLSYWGSGAPLLVHTVISQLSAALTYIAVPFADCATPDVPLDFLSSLSEERTPVIPPDYTLQVLACLQGISHALLLPLGTSKATLARSFGAAASTIHSNSGVALSTVAATENKALELRRCASAPGTPAYSGTQVFGLMDVATGVHEIAAALSTFETAAGGKATVSAEPLGVRLHRFIQRCSTTMDEMFNEDTFVAGGVRYDELLFSYIAFQDLVSSDVLDVANSSPPTSSPLVLARAELAHVFPHLLRSVADLWFALNQSENLRSVVDIADCTGKSAIDSSATGSSARSVLLRCGFAHLDRVIQMGHAESVRAAIDNLLEPVAAHNPNLLLTALAVVWSDNLTIEPHLFETASHGGSTTALTASLEANGADDGLAPCAEDCLAHDLIWLLTPAKTSEVVRVSTCLADTADQTKQINGIPLLASQCSLLSLFSGLKSFCVHLVSEQRDLGSGYLAFTDDRLAESPATKPTPLMSPAQVVRVLKELIQNPPLNMAAVFSRHPNDNAATNLVAPTASEAHINATVLHSVLLHFFYAWNSVLGGLNTSCFSIPHVQSLLRDLAPLTNQSTNSGVSGNSPLLSPISVFLLTKIFNEIISALSNNDEKRDQKELQEICQRLLEANASIAGSGLDQGNWLRRTLRSPLSGRINDVADHPFGTLLKHRIAETIRASPIPTSRSDASITETGKVRSKLLPPGSSQEILKDRSERIESDLIVAYRENITAHSLQLLSEHMAVFLDVVYRSEEKDRVPSVLTNGIMSNILPFLKTRTASNARHFALASQVLATLSSYQFTRRAWRKEVFDMLMDANFFQMSPSALYSWCVLVDNLMTQDKNAFKEALTRLTVSQSSGLNIFSSKEAEYEQRSMYLKKLNFIVYTSEWDQYSRSVSEVLERVTDNLRAISGIVVPITTQVFLCTRVLISRISSASLASLWHIVIPELVSVFKNFADRLHGRKGPAPTAIALQQYPLSQLYLLLSACKLLATMLLLPENKAPQLFFHRWVFVAGLSLDNDNENQYSDEGENAAFTPYMTQIAMALAQIHGPSSVPRPASLPSVQSACYSLLALRHVSKFSQLEPFFYSLGSSGTSACDRREDLEGSQHLLNQILDAALFSDFLEPLRT
uniref:Uncharacterized protein n=1 Tax=Schistocephalus solidus TaxID=70667 RepID=A0A0X3P420_SCHSO